MRKPRRLVFLVVWSILAALMLLLAVRSYVRSDNITYGRHQLIERPDFGSSVGFNVGGFVYSSEGLLYLGYAEPPQPAPDGSRFPSGIMWASSPSARGAPLIPRGGGLGLGFHFTWRWQYSAGPGPNAKSTFLRVPIWFLFLACYMPPAARLLGIWRERRRTRLGLCRHCGYDLRESRERCPECGAAPEVTPRTAA